MGSFAEIDINARSLSGWVYDTDSFYIDTSKYCTMAFRRSASGEYRMSLSKTMKISRVTKKPSTRTHLDMEVRMLMSSSKVNMLGSEGY